MENNNDVTKDERYKILNEIEPMSFLALAFTLMTLTEEERNRLDGRINEWKKRSDMPTVESEDGEIRPMWFEDMAKELKEKNNDKL